MEVVYPDWQEAPPSGMRIHAQSPPVARINNHILSPPPLTFSVEQAKHPSQNNREIQNLKSEIRIEHALHPEEELKADPHLNSYEPQSDENPTQPKCPLL